LNDDEDSDEKKDKNEDPMARWLLFVAFVALALGADNLRSPERQWSARALLAVIDLYQATASPVISAAGVNCRFEPSCSRYAEGAIHKHGAAGGVTRTAVRLARCGPWTPAGTVDPP